MMKKHFEKLLLISACFNMSCALAATGEKAFAACKEQGTALPECHNILHPAYRVRVQVDLLLYPHMVLLGYGNDSSNPVWKCGGSLISRDWILTAAHCKEDPKLGEVKWLRAGTATFEFDEIEDVAQDRTIAEVVPHPDYKPPSKYNDIALVRADPPFTLNRDIRVACLHIERHLPFKRATVIGFGTTAPGAEKGSETLMEVDVDLIDEEQCNDAMKPLIKRGVLSDGVVESQLCAGDWLHGGRDACQGDSGGPLNVLLNDTDCVRTFPLHYAVGVTSFGRGCGHRRAPGVYTRVSYYVPWIESVVWPRAL